MKPVGAGAEEGLASRVLSRGVFLLLKYQTLGSAPGWDGVEACPDIFCVVKFVNKNIDMDIFFPLKNEL